MKQEVNGTERVYVVFDEYNIIEIAAVCATRPALERYLQEQFAQFENSWKEDSVETVIKQVKSYSHEEHELSVVAPKINYQVSYYDIDRSILETPNSDSAKLRTFYCHFPIGEIEFFKTEEEANNWASCMVEEDNILEECIFISDIEVLF